jgi:hypothetical protein
MVKRVKKPNFHEAYRAGPVENVDGFWETSEYRNRVVVKTPISVGFFVLWYFYFFGFSGRNIFCKRRKTLSI